MDTANVSFTVTVNSVNDVPTLDWLPDQAMHFKEGGREVDLAGIGTGAANENQQLELTAFSTDQARLKVANFSYSSPQPTGLFKIDPNDQAFGIYTVTVLITENQPTTNNVVSRQFDVYVRDQANSVPTISALANQTIAEDTSTVPVVFTVGDQQTAASQLMLVGKSSNHGLVADDHIVFGGTGANRTVTVTPLANQSGTAIISVLVVDEGFGMALRTFQLTVNPVNDAPTISPIPGANRPHRLPHARHSLHGWRPRNRRDPPGRDRQFLESDAGAQRQRAIGRQRPRPGLAGGTGVARGRLRAHHVDGERWQPEQSGVL